MKRILIIGATSTIAQHAARMWATRGDRLYLVARNKERLEGIATDLRIRGGNRIITHTMDVNDLARHAIMLDEAERALDGIDMVLVAHGTLPNQLQCERDVNLMIAEIHTNVLSTLSLLTQIANRFEAKQEGTIGVISSVAGDRGRASNYVYGCAKAMVTAFTSGLRQRLHKSNVAVVTIKPGFVDTPMTAAFKKSILWVKPAVVAAQIVKAIDQRKDEVYVPGFWWAVMVVIKAIPSPFFKKMNL